MAIMMKTKITKSKSRNDLQRVQEEQNVIEHWTTWGQATLVKRRIDTRERRTV